jgi:predicted transcriptional regulator
MAKEALFTMKLESELRDEFMAEAKSADRPASQIVREFMRDFVEKQRHARAYDIWFRARVEEGIREADDPTVKRIPHDEIVAEWRRERAEIVKQLSDRAK